MTFIENNTIRRDIDITIIIDISFTFFYTFFSVLNGTALKRKTKNEHTININVKYIATK